MEKRNEGGNCYLKHPLPGVVKASSGMPCILSTIPYKEREELIVYTPCKVNNTCSTYSVRYSDNL